MNTLNFTAAPATSTDCGELLRLATLGAIVGGGLAGARQFQQVQNGQQLPLPAVLETGKTAVAAGLATAVAGALAVSLTEQGVLRLGIMGLAAGAMFYALQAQLALEDING